jgi:hypothetical protein
MGLIDVGASFHRIGGNPLAPAPQGCGFSLILRTATPRIPTPKCQSDEEGDPQRI